MSSESDPAGGPAAPPESGADLDDLGIDIDALDADALEDLARTLRERADALRLVERELADLDDRLTVVSTERHALEDGLAVDVRLTVDTPVADPTSIYLDRVDEPDDNGGSPDVVHVDDAVAPLPPRHASPVTSAVPVANSADQDDAAGESAADADAAADDWWCPACGKHSDTRTGIRIHIGRSDCPDVEPVSEDPGLDHADQDDEAWYCSHCGYGPRSYDTVAKHQQQDERCTDAERVTETPETNVPAPDDEIWYCALCADGPRTRRGAATHARRSHDGAPVEPRVGGPPPRSIGQDLEPAVERVDDEGDADDEPGADSVDEDDSDSGGPDTAPGYESLPELLADIREACNIPNDTDSTSTTKEDLQEIYVAVGCGAKAPTLTMTKAEVAAAIRDELGLEGAGPNLNRDNLIIARDAVVDAAGGGDAEGDLPGGITREALRAAVASHETLGAVADAVGASTGATRSALFAIDQYHEIREGGGSASGAGPGGGRA